jgi:hypothetical protein
MLSRHGLLLTPKADLFNIFVDSGVKLSLSMFNMTRTAKRGAHRKADCIFIGAWIPIHLMDRIDLFVQQEDLDRSKMLRRALEEKLGTKLKGEQ